MLQKRSLLLNLLSVHIKQISCMFLAWCYICVRNGDLRALGHFMLRGMIFFWSSLCDLWSVSMFSKAVSSWPHHLCAQRTSCFQDCISSCRAAITLNFPQLCVGFLQSLGLQGPIVSVVAYIWAHFVAGLCAYICFPLRKPIWAGLVSMSGTLLLASKSCLWMAWAQFQPPPIRPWLLPPTHAQPSALLLVAVGHTWSRVTCLR